MLEKIKQYRLGVLIVLLLLGASGFIFMKLRTQTLAPNLVFGSGRMDGDLINLNAKYAGSIDIEEGQAVHRGDVIAVLKSDEYEAQKNQIEAQINAKETELKVAETTISETLRQANDTIQIRKHQHEELEKSIASQIRSLEQDKRDLERVQNLYAQNLIEKRQMETADLKYKTAHNTLDALYQKRAQTSLAIQVATSEHTKANAQQQTLQARL